MTKVIQTENTKSLEEAVISNWTGWDGDINYLTFSGVVLQPNVEAYLIDQALDVSLELFVMFNLETSRVEISAYSGTNDTPEWERKFNLKVSLPEVDDYITSQRYSL